MKKLILGCLLVLGFSGSATAGLITYDFAFGATSGPLAPFTDTGNFTISDSIIPIGGGNVTGLLLDLVIEIGGVPFDETSANTGGFIFNADGSLDLALFGSNCVAGSCDALPDGNWWIFGGTTSGTFAYSSGEDFYDDGSALISPRNVPAPATLALFGLGLAGLGWSRRKKVSRTESND